MSQTGATPSQAHMPTPEAPPLAITRLSLSQFRNYERARLDLAAGPVVLVGPNGAGKTNLLEALSTLSPGRGLRGAAMAELARLAGDGTWAVAAELQGAQGIVKLGTGIQPEPGESSARRIVHVDGDSVPAAELARHVRLVWLTPAMDRLFTEGASERRRFFDRLAYGFSPDHGTQVNAYEKAMRERNRLLKDGRFDAAWLEALEARMAEHGVAIAAARNETIARLRGATAAGIGPFPRADLALDGLAEAALQGVSAGEVEDQLKQLWADGRGADAQSGRTLEGPHRSDILVTHVDKDMPAALCSTGEQKALLISIILANARLQAARFGTPPVLLLDEIGAHLDAERRAALFAELLDLSGQAWMSGTDLSLFDSLSSKAAFFRVEAGILCPIEVDSTI